MLSRSEKRFILEAGRELLSSAGKAITSQCLLRGAVVHKKKVHFKTAEKVPAECSTAATELMRRKRELILVPGFTGEADMATESSPSNSKMDGAYSSLLMQSRHLEDRANRPESKIRHWTIR
jgi:hypothetical protein